MNIDDYTKITHKRYSSLKPQDENKKIKYLKNLITRVLLSIILIISILILTKFNDHNKELINKYLFQDSLKFTKVNKWYQDKFGNLIPDTNNNELVFSSDLSKNKYTNYQDGVQIEYPKNSPVSTLYGGIIIFIGEKDNYGNVVIIQGNDGIDYTYGNITNININLYDYIEKDTIIGEAKDDYIYLVLEKDGKYLKYDEYLKEN